MNKIMRIVGFTTEDDVADLDDIMEICENRDMTVAILADGNLYDMDTGSLIAIPVSGEDHLDLC